MKKTLFLLLSLALTIPAFSQWDGTSSPWTQGTGTQSDPYQISSPQHLAYLADMVTSGVNDYNGKYFLLTQDISLSNQSWMPIGDATHPFKGNFDGGGHTIDSLIVSNSTFDCSGLFGKVDYGTIKKIHLNCRLNAGTFRGGIAAAMNNGVIDSCNVNIISSANTSTCNYYGGIVGSCSGNVKNCIVYSTSITASVNAGGIIGGKPASNNLLKIENCSFHGQIHSSNVNSYIGGIVGYSLSYGSDTILDCHNYGTLYGCMCIGGIIGYSHGPIRIERCANWDSIISQGGTRNTFVGGIIGYSNGGGNVIFSSNNGCIRIQGAFGESHNGSYYSGLTSSSHTYCFVSGIGSGIISNSSSHQVVYTYSTQHTTQSHYYTCSYTYYSVGSNLNISYCYNTGSISGGTGANINQYGVGNGSIKCCYNTGSIPSSTNSYAIGTGIINNCYYLNSCGVSGSGNSRTESQMRSTSFPIVLNADSTVFVMDETNINNGYPVFWFTVAYDVTSDSATDVNSFSAALHGHYGGVADTTGFVYGLNNSNPMTQIIVDAINSPVSHTLSGLQPNTQYRYAFFVKHNGTYIYGDTLTFTTKPTYNVSVSSNNNAWGSVSGGGTYGYGEIDTLVATPTNHYRFLQWNDGNTENPRLITVLADTNLTAQFATQIYTVYASVNNEAWGYLTGTGTYEYGSPAIITAIPYTGYHFVYWTNETESFHNEINPWIISSVSCNTTSTIAVFAPNQYTVTLQSNNDTLGIVYGSGTYQYGQQAVLIAQPIGNNVFTQWSDGDTNAYRIITVTSNVSYTAIFTDAIFNVIAQSSNSSYGTVSGSGSYARGSQVQLTAVPNEGYHFTQWNDGNTDNPRTITVNADATYTAQFAANTYVLNVNSSNTLMGSATGGGIFSYGQQTTIEATAMPHYRFIQWNDGVNSNPRVVTITSDTTFTAFFEQMPQYTITVISADETKGSVSGGGTFYGGEQTVINATAASGNVFDRWSDGNTEAIRTLTVTSDATYTAYFSGVRFTVNVYSNDDQMGSVSGGGEYEQGSQATVTATPANGCHFVRWNNGVETNPYTFTVYSDVNLIANFERVTGVDDIEELPFTITSRRTSIAIYNADNCSVLIRDILGRTIYTSKKYDGGWIDLRQTGVYLVSINEYKTIKIVLIN